MRQAARSPLEGHLPEEGAPGTVSAPRCCTRGRALLRACHNRHPTRERRVTFGPSLALDGRCGDGPGPGRLAFGLHRGERLAVVRRGVVREAWVESEC